jgi:hypothetical protein
VLEGAQATLKQREDEASKLNGELVQLSISHEDLRQSLEEQETTVRDLRREAEEARQALDSQRKQVKGGFHFRPFSFVDSACSGSAPDSKWKWGPVTRNLIGIYSIRVPIWSKTSTHGYINGANLSPIGYAGMGTFL